MKTEYLEQPDRIATTDVASALKCNSEKSPVSLVNKEEGAVEFFAGSKLEIRNSYIDKVSAGLVIALIVEVESFLPASVFDRLNLESHGLNG